MNDSHSPWISSRGPAGYHVHAVGVLCDGANTQLTDGLIGALKDAGLNNVTALTTAGARGIFTQPQVADTCNAAARRARPRLRHYWAFAAAVAFTSTATAFAFIDHQEGDLRPDRRQPVVTPFPHEMATPIPGPPSAPAPPGIPPQQVPPAILPAPEYSSPQRTPARQELPAQNPYTPAPAEPPAVEPAPADTCTILCGVTL